jgi:hypothetical protein
MSVIGLVVDTLMRHSVELAMDRGLARATRRSSRSTSCADAPYRLELDASFLTAASLQRMPGVTADRSRLIASDPIRRAAQSSLSMAERRRMLTEASFRYDEIRRTESPGTIPQVQSTLMYVLLTSLLGEPTEPLTALRESLSGQLRGYGVSFVGVEAIGARKYDATGASLRVAMDWQPRLLAGSSTWTAPAAASPALRSRIPLEMSDSPRFSAQARDVFVLEPAGSGSVPARSRSRAALSGKLPEAGVPAPRPPAQPGSPASGRAGSAAVLSYHSQAMHALNSTSMFISGGPAAVADGHIEIRSRRFPVIIISKEEAHEIIALSARVARLFDMPGVLCITDELVTGKGLSKMAGRTVMKLYWRPRDGPEPIRRAIRTLDSLP